MRHKVQFKDGKITFYQPKRFQQDVESREGQDGFLDLSEYSPAASTDQYGFYFATLQWYIDNSEYYGGNEKDDLDWYLCEKYLTLKRVVYFDGVAEEVTSVEKETAIGKKRMAEFTTKVLAELAEESGLVSPSGEEIMIGKYKSVKSKLTL
jgi:hypothetical protein